MSELTSWPHNSVKRMQIVYEPARRSETEHVLGARTRAISFHILTTSRTSVTSCGGLNHVFFSRIKVITAVRLKIAVSWVVAPCSLAGAYRHFRDTFFLPTSGGASTLQTLLNCYQTVNGSTPSNTQHPT